MGIVIINLIKNCGDRLKDYREKNINNSTLNTKESIKQTQSFTEKKTAHKILIFLSITI